MTTPVHYNAKVFQIDRQAIREGMRRATVRVEERLDSAIAVCFQGEYVRVRRCEPTVRELSPPKTVATKQPRPAPASKRKSDWMKGFSIRSGPSLREAIEVSNAHG